MSDSQLRPVQSFWPGQGAEAGADVRDLFDPRLLGAALAAGHVKVQRHPSLPLSIYNYSDTCAYERAWNAATMQCRGLVVHDDGRVVARPFPKFFNHGEPEAADLDLSAPAVVSDKMDGSLGVLYPTGYVNHVHGRKQYAVATRGSFISDQARHANEVWQDRYHGAFDPPEGVTMLVEIVYPGNRIVLDYGDTDDLVLLGGVDIATGRTFGPDAFPDWPGPRTKVFPYMTLGEALAAPPRSNAEGLVVHLSDTDQRVKIKQEDYVRLHRIVTGLNARVVWEHLVADEPLANLTARLPDELYQWVADVAAALTNRVEQAAHEVETVYAATMAALPTGWSRKDYALAVKDHVHKSALFMRVDGRDYRPLLWRQVEPRGDVRPTNAPTEEVA